MGVWEGEAFPQQDQLQPLPVLIHPLQCYEYPGFINAGSGLERFDDVIFGLACSGFADANLNSRVFIFV